MCMSDAIQTGVAMGMFKKAASMNNANNTSSAPTTNKKKKKKGPPRNLRLRGGAGNRSMFGDKENQNANG